MKSWEGAPLSEVLRIAFATLGCKANWCDTESMAQALSAKGFMIVPFSETADAYVVNTCTVTAVADHQSRQMLRRAIGRGGGATVIATGCYGEMEPDVLHGIDGVDAVFGTKDREKLTWYLISKFGKGMDGNSTIPVVQSRARAFLKIQDGCNKRCSYCIVPRARGRSKSMPPEEVVQSCISLSKGHREIVLSGIDIGQYGRDLLNDLSLSGLLKNLIQTKGISRIRISTLDPRMVDDALIRLIAASSAGLCRHIHLSIQSGSDPVLKEMTRGYTAADITHTAEKLAHAVPDIAITGDVIAGFPGETDGQHRQTVELLSALPLAGLHVFPYSRRPDTRAATMKQLSRDVVKVRAAELRALAKRKILAFLAGFVGKSLKVIVTSKTPDDDGFIRAFSDNAISVCLPEGSVAYRGIGKCIVTEVAGFKVKGIWESAQMTKNA